MVTGLWSCSKEKALQKEYYGTLKVEATIVSSSAKVVLVDGADTMKVDLGIATGTYAVAGKPQQLLIYDAGTDKLLGDTTVTLEKDEKKTLKFAYFEEAGLKQFYTNLMPGDSVRVYYKYNLEEAYPAIDVYIFKSTDTTLATGVIAIQENLQYGVSGYPHFTDLLASTPDGSYVNYMIKIKDRATGLFINDKGATTRDYFSVTLGGGQFVFSNINKYTTKGRFSVENITF